MPELSWKHHTLIQALLSRGPLEEKDFYFVFEGVSGRNPATHRQILNDCLLKINKELAFVQFELRGCRNQYDGKIYYGVVNNIADEQAKLGTQYSVPQIAFYKAVIEAIVQDETAQGSISNIDALNVRLEHQADLCQNEECTVRIHNYCLRKKFSQKRVDKLCPGCGTEWRVPKSEFIEEDEGEEQNEPIQSQVPLSGSAKRKRLRNCKSELNAVNTGLSQPSQRVPDPRRSSRRSTPVRYA
ncbi:hypothetical protein AQUCO_06900047v1 [Aquilegia coerulea]|uniref:Non-structural maintenance of chromosomes element 1 homolog n=1 Tax=Aquilegia coerulea TaxID=218851 RepID=A0A2G5CB46_AQUCA|nr:hypothetical protein AQUCO_06900047v1 [Aquilegia coerulea]